MEIVHSDTINLCVELGWYIPNMSNKRIRKHLSYIVSIEPMEKIYAIYHRLLELDPSLIKLMDNSKYVTPEMMIMVVRRGYASYLPIMIIIGMIEEFRNDNIPYDVIIACCREKIEIYRFLNNEELFHKFIDMEEFTTDDLNMILLNYPNYTNLLSSRYIMHTRDCRGLVIPLEAYEYTLRMIYRNRMNTFYVALAHTVFEKISEVLSEEDMLHISISVIKKIMDDIDISPNDNVIVLFKEYFGLSDELENTIIGILNFSPIKKSKN